jgi:hypothetical protein
VRKRTVPLRAIEMSMRKISVDKTEITVDMAVIANGKARNGSTAVPDVRISTKTTTKKSSITTKL